MEVQKGGWAGLRLAGSRGSSTEPDGHAASLPGSLEDRWQGQAGAVPG